MLSRDHGDAGDIEECETVTTRTEIRFADEAFPLLGALLRDGSIAGLSSGDPNISVKKTKSIETEV